MSDELARLISKKFIARPDVKAIQHPSGAWSPHVKDPRDSKSERIPWRKSDLLDHLASRRTFGHYLLSPMSEVKLFAFDIDLEETKLNDDPALEKRYFFGTEAIPVTEFNPRVDWLNRAHPARTYMKLKLKTVAHMLMKAIFEQLQIQTAAAYSGGKGVHVYGLLPNPMSAGDAREGGQIVLDTLGCFEASRGSNFFKHKDKDPLTGFDCLSIELFPKQDSIKDKDLGNLMRLPLGRNLKSKDPTFFIDMTAPLASMIPVDPIWALTTTDPWRRPNE